jgi:DNA-binding HxlR family transcriptional regulator
VEEEPNDVIVLSAIDKGAKKFDKIRKETQIEGQELNKLLERLENKGFIVVIEKKGFFGPRKEIILTEKGAKELDERKFELQQNWNQLVTLWKSGDKEKLQQHIDDNRSIFPAMMFMGIMDMMMFSSMMSFMGLAMTSFIPDQYMNDASSSDIGHDGGQAGAGGDFGHGDSGSGDMGGFDVNF